MPIQIQDPTLGYFSPTSSAGTALDAVCNLASASVLMILMYPWRSYANCHMSNVPIMNLNAGLSNAIRLVTLRLAILFVKVDLIIVVNQHRVSTELARYRQVSQGIRVWEISFTRFGICVWNWGGLVALQYVIYLFICILARIPTRRTRRDERQLCDFLSPFPTLWYRICLFAKKRTLFIQSSYY